MSGEDMALPGLVSLTHPRRRRGTRPPILLVPGSFSGAWIWRDSFQPALHRAGYDVHAMSFAGHGLRGLALNRRGLEDYVDDLRRAVAALPAPPVLVAHSLGGLVAMKLAGEMPLRGLALLSPIPAQGAWRSLAALARRSPASLGKLLAVALEPRVTRLGAPPQGIYSHRADPGRARDITGRLQAESLRVLFEALFPSGLSPRQILAPMHFFAAEGDHVIPASEVRRCAEVFSSPFTLYPGMSHTFQAEPEYRRVCRDIVAWIRRAT